jgi:hypothetical protein
MGSVRNHIRIARSPDDVWRVVSDAAVISEWAPDIKNSSSSENMRRVEFDDGTCLEEEIVTSDDELRRFQYRVVRYKMGDFEGPSPVDAFATVDVIEDGDGTLVIYSTELVPVEDDPGGQLERTAVDAVKPQSAGFLRGLKEYLER